MMHLNELAVLCCEGADAAQFLQGQLTCDVLALTGATLAAYCNRKGRVIATLFVIRESAERFLLVVDASLCDVVLQTLSKYIIIAKVRLEKIALKVYGSFEAVEGAYEVVQGLFLHCSVEFLPTIHNHWWREAILKKLVWVTGATSEQFVPQMLGLEKLGAVNFTKGCYVGQEIVARMQHLGKLKQQVMLVEHGQFSAEQIGQADAAGVLVACADNSDGSQCGLLVVRSLG